MFRNLHVPCKEAPGGSVSDFKELSHKLSATARPRGSSQGKQRQTPGWPTVEACQVTFLPVVFKLS